MLPRTTMVYSIVLSAAISGTASGQQPDACQSRKGDKPVIEYKTKGGLTGSLNEWLIYSDGLVCRNMVNEGKISPAKLTYLLDESMRLGFFAMPKGYKCGSVDPCSQCINYKVTIRSNARKNTINSCGRRGRTYEEASVLAQIEQALLHEVR